MNQIIKTFLTVLLMLIIILIGAGLIVCALDAQKAEKMNSSYANTIASHNYSDASINQCKAEAQNNDYVLTVRKYDTNKDGYNDVCECILEYDYSLKMLNTGSATTTNSKHHYSRIVQ